MSDPCLASDVSLWMENNCTAKASQQGQSFFNQLFTNFYGTHQGVYVEGVDDVDADTMQFQDLLTAVCNDGFNGKYCREPLLQRCQGYSRIDTENSTIRKMCGCYLPDSEYNQDLPRACDTVCTSFETVKYHQQGSNTPEQCSANVCIIDGVTLSIKGSSVGDITFNQLCPFCAGINECRCFISDINIITQDSSLGNVSISQNCGDNSVCYQKNIDGSTVSVPCETYFSTLGENPSVVEQQSHSYRWIFWTCLVVAIGLLILLITGLVMLVKQPRPEEVVQTVKYYRMVDGERVPL